MQAQELYNSGQYEQAVETFDEGMEQHADSDDAIALIEGYIAIKIRSLKQLGWQDEIDKVIGHLNEKYAVSSDSITQERTLRESDHFEMAKLVIPNLLLMLECYEEILALNWPHWALLAAQYRVAQLIDDQLLGLKIQAQFDGLDVRGRDGIMMLVLNDEQHPFHLQDVQRFEISNLPNDNAYLNVELNNGQAEVSGSIPFPYNDGICAEGQITIKHNDIEETLTIDRADVKRLFQWSPYGFEITLKSEGLGDVSVLIGDIHKYAHRERVVRFEK